MLPLLNKQFLRQLDQHQHKVIYARVISLNNREEPIEKIEGVVTGGSISVDGSSAIRRSCNLTMTSENININNVYWGISNKISIEIGLQNDIDNRYEKIIWFPQGIYILTDFKTSHQVNNYTITVNGKDKMCLLNGDINGTFNAETDLGIEYLVNANQEITERKIPITEIIQEMIRHYAKEPFANIIIKDIDSFGLQLLENKDTDKIYYLIYSTTQNNDNGKKKMEAILTDDSNETIFCQTCADIKKVSDIKNYADKVCFYQTIEEDDINLINTVTNFSKFTFRNHSVYVQQINQGNTIGYTPVDLTYPDELVASIGDTVTSILDKIVQMLGDFEYFYNLKGQFVFQKKKSYISSSWNKIINAEGESYITPALLSSKSTYSFDNSVLITSFQNDPKLNNIKNDYTVWGIKKTTSGGEVPIHARYAIDKKPQLYCSFNEDDLSKPGVVYCSKDFYNNEISSIIADNYNNALAIKKRPPDFLLNATYYDYNKWKSSTSSTPTTNMIIHYSEEELNEMWWTVLDWGRCYEALAGERPTKKLFNYGQNPCCATIQFPGESAPRFLRSQLIFDVDTDTGIPHTGAVTIEGRQQGSWSPFQHGFSNCGHTFDFFMDLDETNNLDSWIFCPQIPEEDRGKVMGKDYTLVRVDWREIIFQMAKDYYKHYHEDDYATILMRNNTFKPGISLYPYGETGYEQYYHDIQGFWRLLYLGYDAIPEDIVLSDYFDGADKNYPLWNKNIINDPMSLLFWFDFFDSSNSNIEKFSVHAIGDRAKNINDEQIRAIIYPDTPDIVFIEAGRNDQIKIFEDGYQVYTDADSAIISAMSTSNRRKTIHDQIDTMLYDYSYFNNSITINCIPIYYLEPNTVVSVDDNLSNIHGYFTLNKFTIPLTYNGTMSITAVKVPQKIY